MHTIIYELFMPLLAGFALSPRCLLRVFIDVGIIFCVEITLFNLKPLFSIFYPHNICWKDNL